MTVRTPTLLIFSLTCVHKILINLFHILKNHRSPSLHSFACVGVLFAVYYKNNSSYIISQKCILLKPVCNMLLFLLLSHSWETSIYIWRGRSFDHIHCICYLHLPYEVKCPETLPFWQCLKRYRNPSSIRILSISGV